MTPNEQGRPQRAAPPPSTSLPNCSTGGGEHPGRTPRLIVELELERSGRIILDAETFEDELRLRYWLRRATSMEALPGILAHLLDDLDELDAGAAA